MESSFDKPTKPPPQTSRKFVWIGIGFGILLLIGISIAFGVNHDRNSTNSVDNTSGTNSTNSTNSPNSPNSPSSSPSPSIPSNTTFKTWDGKNVNLSITPNPALKKSLYGINYGPVNATYPSCGNTLGDVIEDVKLLSQLTDRIRIYGMDCNAVNYTILAIKYLGLKMTVIPTIWVDGNSSTYQRQYSDFFANLQEHGFDYIPGVSVGNEVLFSEYVTAKDLYSRIADVRSKARAMPKAPKNFPVFTSDIGSNVDSAFVNAVDIVIANVHPYFAGVIVQEASNWTLSWYDQNDASIAKKQNKPSVIGEVGWPTNGATEKGAVATVPNLQTFLSSFVCYANSKNYKYYYFETFDTPWKTQRYTVLEGSWGLFYPDRSLKAVTLPDCRPSAPEITVL